MRYCVRNSHNIINRIHYRIFDSASKYSLATTKPTNIKVIVNKQIYEQKRIIYRSEMVLIERENHELQLTKF